MRHTCQDDFDCEGDLGLDEIGCEYDFCGELEGALYLGRQNQMFQKLRQNTFELDFPKPRNSTLSSLMILVLDFLTGGERDRFLLAGEDGLFFRDPWLLNMAMIPSFRSDIGSMNVGDSLPTFPTSGDMG